MAYSVPRQDGSGRSAAINAMAAGQVILKGSSPASRPLAAWTTFINRQGDVAGSVHAGTVA